MPPAFDSTKQAAAFALMLLFFLVAPWLAGKSLLPPREQAYSSEGTGQWGPYPWIQRQIFEETNDIDISFIGSSHMCWDIDTPYVQQKLDERLRRKTVVRSICWGGAGFDALYIITKDLLEHRHVKTLVFYDESNTPHPNAKAPNWFRFGDDGGVLAGLPVKEKGIFYFAAMVGMPRNIIEIFTPNLAEDTNAPGPGYVEFHFRAAEPETSLGSLSARIAFDVNVVSDGTNTPYASYYPRTGVTPSDLLVYTAKTATNFVFLNQPLPAWQSYFARQFGLLAKNHGCRLVLLHLPTFDERGSPTITESVNWPGLLQLDCAMMGIPARRLFAGLSESEIKRLFAERGHLNQNGQKYFTPLIVPSLFQLYENHPNN